MKLLNCLFLATVLTAPIASAALYSDGHGDIGVEFENGELHLHYHLGGAGSDYAVVGGEFVFGEHYEPGEIEVSIPGGLRSTLTGDFPLLGATAGSSVWVLPDGDPYPVVAPFLGFSTEDLNPAQWGDIRFSLGNVTSPSGNGHFAMWSGLSGGGIEALFSTVNGAAPNFFDISGAGHVHQFLGFTEAGVWQIELTASGIYLPDGTTKSATETFTFHVVPEPSSLLALGASVIALSLRRRR